MVKIVQLGKFDEKLWHAGRSKWKGINGLNGYSVGIELVNSGYLRRSGDAFLTRFGRRVSGREVKEATLTGDNPNKRYWQQFTQAQLDVMQQVVKALSKEYKIATEDILGQYHISPGRRQGPGPLLDFAALRKSISK